MGWLHIVVVDRVDFATSANWAKIFELLWTACLMDLFDRIHRLLLTETIPFGEQKETIRESSVGPWSIKSAK